MSVGNSSVFFWKEKQIEWGFTQFFLFSLSHDGSDNEACAASLCSPHVLLRERRDQSQSGRTAASIARETSPGEHDSPGASSRHARHNFD